MKRLEATREAISQLKKLSRAHESPSLVAVRRSLEKRLRKLEAELKEWGEA